MERLRDDAERMFAAKKKDEVERKVESRPLRQVYGARGHTTQTNTLTQTDTQHTHSHIITHTHTHTHEHTRLERRTYVHCTT
jgi:hypothetical protein